MLNFVNLNLTRLCVRHCASCVFALLISAQIAPCAFAKGGINQNSVSKTQDIQCAVHALVHRTGSYATTVTSSGYIGSGYIDCGIDPSIYHYFPSFEFPKDSRREYLYSAALWVGGIVGEDTLVSIGNDGWFIVNEFWPETIDSGLMIVPGDADLNIRAVFRDTFPSDAGWSETLDYARLGLRVTQTSRSWVDYPFDDLLIIEFVIENVSSETIARAWAGFYVDGDVLHSNTTSGFTDDISGYVPDMDIAYLFDNNGHDFGEETVWDSTSLRAALGAKIIDFWPLRTNKPNFNWWVSNGNPAADFGPRLQGTPVDPFRVFGEYLGTPVTDEDKFYILSHPERDYNQIESALDHSAEGWLGPNEQFGAGISDGWDTRFLISQGGVDLAPGDSMRMVIALVIGDNFHVNPIDFAETFDPSSPEEFYNRLDFTDLVANMNAAESLYQSGYEVSIYTPPPAPTLMDSLSESPTIGWVYSSNQSVVGYDIFVMEIPDSFIFCDIAPIDTPSFGPTSKINSQPLSVDFYRLENLQDGAWYAVGVGVTAPDSLQRISEPVVFRNGKPRAPELTPEYENEDQRQYNYVVQKEEVMLSWIDYNKDTDHFNIYRTTASDYTQTYYPPRVFGPALDCGTFNLKCDSLIDSVSQTYVCAYRSTPYLVVAGTNTKFEVHVDSAGKYEYQITAVDAAGHESAPTETITVLVIPRHRKPLSLYVAKASGTGYINYDSVMAFFLDYLGGYEPKIFAESPFFDNDFNFSNLSAFETLIIDESPVLLGTTLTGQLSWPNVITDYQRTGGKVIYFGSGYSFGYRTRLDGLSMSSLDTGTAGREMFGLDSTALIPAQLHNPSNASESLFNYFQPIGADPKPGSHLPILNYHHFGLYSLDYFNEGPLPFKGVMFPREDNTEILYTYRSGRDTVSQLHGLPVGIKYTPETHTAYTFFMEPWEMEPEQAQALFAAILGDIQTDVSEDSEAALPRVFSLAQNFPNPFNPSTEIHFSSPTRSHVTLTVYNILGQKVATLVDEIKSAGAYSVQWDASRHASGIYFYQLQSGETRISKKALLLK